MKRLSKQILAVLPVAFALLSHPIARAGTAEVVSSVGLTLSVTPLFPVGASTLGLGVSTGLTSSDGRTRPEEACFGTEAQRIAAVFMIDQRPNPDFQKLLAYCRGKFQNLRNLSDSDIADHILKSGSRSVPGQAVSEAASKSRAPAVAVQDQTGSSGVGANSAQ